jgi:hypothetical protein
VYYPQSHTQGFVIEKNIKHGNTVLYNVELILAPEGDKRLWVSQKSILRGMLECNREEVTG